jgi:RimJ/RimL family protein N-acetyltransferase
MTRSDILKAATASVLKAIIMRKPPEERPEIVLEEGLPEGYMEKMVDKFFPFIHYVDPLPGEKTSYSAKRGNAMLGSVSIKITPEGRKEIGITVAPGHQGKGLSRKLVELLMDKHPHEYYDWKCHKDNVKSLRLLKSLGGGLLKLPDDPNRTMLRGLIASNGFVTNGMKDELEKAIGLLS